MYSDGRERRVVVNVWIDRGDGTRSAPQAWLKLSISPLVPISGPPAGYGQGSLRHPYGLRRPMAFRSRATPLQELDVIRRMVSEKLEVVNGISGRGLRNLWEGSSPRSTPWKWLPSRHPPKESERRRALALPKYRVPRLAGLRANRPGRASGHSGAGFAIPAECAMHSVKNWPSSLRRRVRR